MYRCTRGHLEMYCFQEELHAAASGRSMRESKLYPFDIDRSFALLAVLHLEGHEVALHQ